MRAPPRSAVLRATPAIAAALAAILPATAHATYSIGAADTNTRTIGAAGTSCVGNFSVSEIYGPARGRGLVLAQALFNRDNRERAVEMLNADTAPDAILAELIIQANDADWKRRQYAILDVFGRSARYTGEEASAYAGDRGGTSGDFIYATQGNIITGAGVLERTANAFEGGGCDLAERLMLALEAGARSGEGDTRCTPDGIPSDGAFLEVDRPNEERGEYLRLRVDNTRPLDPIILLRAEFDAWRATHPCTAAPDDAGQPPADTGVTSEDASHTDAAEDHPDARSDADAGTASVKSSCSCGTGRWTRKTDPLAALVLISLLLIRRPRANSNAENVARSLLLPRA